MSERNEKMKEYYRKYDYNSRRPVHVDPEDLTEQQRYRLMESENFCMIPWTHIHLSLIHI